MSKTSHAQTDDKTIQDDLDTNAPEGLVQDDSYTTSNGKREPIPVQGDDTPVEDPVNAADGDSDKQLDEDEKAAIDESNIIKERTRGGAEPRNQYQEPDDIQPELAE
ncbi:hypothetical protein VFPPC_18266 [Pochonia chlamydosporia 170]|uniref:Histone chaperone domain-containing protein n=1 Tax=Pochonia chlamydosporia 170 TaxID=1380566 RepID=A0A219AP39_METCM|nr:hypothetical protein VFPPC_18266 [Pochonia chlamydosporia 170]OWT42598.1 hypothetical protein VFPPC_18266 [Pochonia chlamydosporia 170]